MKFNKKSICFFIFCMPTALLILFPAIYVFLVDPLWQWNHPFHLVRFHPDFNERLTKGNYIETRRPAIDTLIVGSSRSAYMNPHDLGTKHGFNFGVSSGHPKEYPEYITLVKNKSSIGLKKVYIEASFFQYLLTDSKKENQERHITNTCSFSSKIKGLFSRDSYKRARTTASIPLHNSYFVSHSIFESFRTYVPPTAQAHQEALRYTYNTYKTSVYVNPPDPKYPSYLKEIHNTIENIQYVIFIPPVSKYLLNLIVESNKLPEYEQWLKSLIIEFGTVYNFMYPNAITLDDSNFQDVHHMTPACSTHIAEQLQKQEQLSDGIIITTRNINDSINMIKLKFFELHRSETSCP